jgi:hypothetical protein
MMNKRFLVVTSALLALTAGSSAWAQQFARPDGVRAGGAGTWTAVPPGPQADAVNEDTADTAGNSYIDSGAGNNSTIIFTLGDNVTNPGAGNYANSHIIRFYCQATVGAKPKGGEGCDAALYLNDTLIGGTNATATRGSFGLIEYTIPDASALDGADYNNLEVRVTSSSLDVDESVQVMKRCLTSVFITANRPVLRGRPSFQRFRLRQSRRFSPAALQAI